MQKRPSIKPYLVPILIGVGLGLVAAVCCAWFSATQFENYSFAARLEFQPHFVSEAERLRREAALLICAQSLVDNGLDFAFRGAAFSYFVAFIWRQTFKKLELVNGDVLYFFLGPRPFSPAGFCSSSFLEISLMTILGLFILAGTLFFVHQMFSGSLALFELLCH